MRVLPLASFAYQATLGLRYKVEQCYEPYDQSRQGGEAPLHRYLCEIDRTNFPSKTQARKAVLHGRVLVLRAGDYSKSISKERNIINFGTVAKPTTKLHDEDIVAIRGRESSSFYPQACTKYLDPPSNAVDLISTKNPVVFEDDHIAIVNKPEGMDTIGEKRKDLQSSLPFMLRPPVIPVGKGVKTERCYLPRPIHRLDRRTSGCVLVAKSEAAMTKFSRLFATRQIQKSYCAITFNEPRKSNGSDCIDVDGKAFSVIDYPIDGKDAVTLWRAVATVKSPAWGKLSLLHLLPRTGRNHQIRRHLSYCLSCPIVGDSKYDGGGASARAARNELGMFLCSNSIEFAHLMMEDERAVRASVPLPDKFYNLLGIDRDDMLV